MPRDALLDSGDGEKVADRISSLLRPLIPLMMIVIT